MMNDQLFFHKLDEFGNEVIFAPFHDPLLASQLPTELTPFNNNSVTLEYGWCWTSIAWPPLIGTNRVATFKLHVNRVMSPYSHLILCVSVPVFAHIQVVGNLGGKCPNLTSFSGVGSRQEVIVPLTNRENNDHILKSLSLIISSDELQAGRIDLSWFGLRNENTFQAAKSNKLHRKKEDWAPFHLPENEWGEIKFAKGLLFSETDLKNIRGKIKLEGWKEHFQILCQHAEKYLTRSPEDHIGRVLPTDDLRYIRKEEHERTPYYWEALTVAFVGLIKKDHRYLMHALRYMFSTLDSTRWVQSAEHIVPTSTWDTRSFMAEMTTTSLAILWDWLDFTLTPPTRELLRQALWDRGISPVLRDLMKFPYMKEMNQGAVFSRACILGGLMLEDTWDLGDFVDKRYSYMEKTLAKYIKPDGFCHEGITYLCQTLQGVLFPIIAYNRMRNRDWKREAKNNLGRCQNFLEAMSLDAPGRGIPTGDSRTSWYCGDGIPILAFLYPESSLKRILYPCLTQGKVFKSSGTLTNSGGILGLVYGPEKVPSPSSIRPKFRKLKHGAIITSTRIHKNNSIGFFFAGSGVSAGHGHPDQGQFILDINGDPIILDPGMIHYQQNETYHLQQSSHHNVLTPISGDQKYPSQTFSSEGSQLRRFKLGDRISASLSLAKVWPNHFNEYTRKITTKTPLEFIILDEGESISPQQLAFHLQIPFDSQAEKNKIHFEAGNYAVNIEAFWAQEIVKESQYNDCHEQMITHIAIHSAMLKKFRLKTIISLKLK